METPAAMFDSYDYDFKQLLACVRERLDGSQDQGADRRKPALRLVELELDEADELLSQMELEIQGIPASLRSTYTTRARTAKADLARAKKIAREAHRGELLGEKGGVEKYTSSDKPYDNERERLLAGTAILEDGSQRLRDSERIALETDSQGSDTLRSLSLQRSQIEGARDTLHTADSSIDRASGTVRVMIRQAYRQKAVTGAIVLVLILTVGAILYLKLF